MSRSHARQPVVLPAGPARDERRPCRREETLSHLLGDAHAENRPALSVGEILFRVTHEPLAWREGEDRVVRLLRLNDLKPPLLPTLLRRVLATVAPTRSREVRYVVAFGVRIAWMSRCGERP